jgi:radical SAM superfamily enzyme
MATPTEFDFIMIKPTHYDDNGYPIVWWRTVLPSNSLAALNGLGRDGARRDVLGPDVRINLTPIDECNTHIDVKKMARDIRKRGSKALIGLVGVQSNQYPHALDLAKEFRAEGLPVVIGGFHVSGCLSMLKELPSEIQEAMDIGCSIFAGEAEEGRLDEVFRDAWNDDLKPMYNYMNDLPNLAGAPTPWLPAESIKTSAPWSSFDLGRGCPFQCSFCTIINVQGRKSRFRSPEDLELMIRENYAQGIKAYFVTDDNLARNKDWEAFFDTLIRLKEEEGMAVHLTIQVDTMCHRIPGFIDKAAKAGAWRVFLGLENINPDNLIAANKRQNKITEYRHMMQMWHERGCFLLAGYILGFPGDTKESILRDIEIIKKELPVDILEFFILTPLPGSEDHKKMLYSGQWMDPDLNKYDLHHRVSHHPKMSDAEWEDAYQAAWDTYFTWDHMETVAKRHARRANGSPRRALQYMNEFRMLYSHEKVHTLEGGVIRRKRRLSRRPGMKIENPLVFYPKYWTESVVKIARYALGFWKEKRMLKKVLAAQDRWEYMDVAISPPNPDDLESMGLFQETRGGAEAVVREMRVRPAKESVAA